MISKPYVLFTRIPIVRTKSDRIFCGSLWAKDLKLHLDYISDFQICCPVVNSNDIQGLEDITEYGIERIFELKKDEGIGSVIRNLLPNLLEVIKACKGSSIVHSGGAGWAFPLSFYLILLRPFFSFQWVIVIESSFWMLGKHDHKTLRKLIDHHVHKLVLSHCVRNADARIFTQSFYREYFLGNEEDRTMISPATWVNEDQLISCQAVENRFLERKGKPLEIIFPTRLIEDKGVFVVFDAINHLKVMGINVVITIMGSGPLEQDCKNFALNNFGNVKVIYRDPVEYGDVFFGLLRNYDVVLVPNLKQEQPRIVFDAFSQGLGVIASDTSGILDITDSSNAIIFKCGDSQSLAKAICYLVENSDIALQMGLSGRNHAAGKTHIQMHLDRQYFFERILDI